MMSFCKYRNEHSSSIKCGVLLDQLSELINYSLTQSKVQDIVLKVDSYSACQRIVIFLYVTQRFITVFTKDNSLELVICMSQLVLLF